VGVTAAAVASTVGAEVDSMAVVVAFTAARVEAFVVQGVEDSEVLVSEASVIAGAFAVDPRPVVME